MALSSEHTYWHLTSSGWVPGSSKTDFNRWNVDAPDGTLKTICYSEKVNHKLHLEKDVETVFEIADKALLNTTENQFPFRGRIEVY